MRIKISANTLVMHRHMVVDETGVTFLETALVGGKRRFRYSEIDLVLMSHNNVLSFQVRQEVFSLPVNPHKKKHQQAINLMMQGLNASVG